LSDTGHFEGRRRDGMEGRPGQGRSEEKVGLLPLGITLY
jgi:hypothetical protein